MQTFWGIPFQFIAARQNDEDNVVVFGDNASLEPIEISIGMAVSRRLIYRELMAVPESMIWDRDPLTPASDT